MVYSVGEGWYPLVEEAIRKLEARGIKYHVYYEKDGTLQFDIDPWTEDARDMLDDIEERSSRTCEYCGRRGSEVTLENGKVKTLCDRCRANYPAVVQRDKERKARGR